MRHALLQCVILLITLNVFWDASDGLVATWERALMWFGYFAVMNILVYINIYLLAKPLLLRNRVSAYVFSALGLVAVVVILIGFLQTLLPDDGYGQQAPAVIGIISSVIAIELLFAGVASLVLFRQWMLSEQRRRELETANLNAELQMLKNQINPHFLFNMLNNCYLLVKKGRREAAEVIFKLEDLLRYQIGDSDRINVTLGGEIGFLNDFLDLEKLRRDDFHFEITDNINEPELKIPPMLFIPFAENAVKHNSDSENRSYVNIAFSRWGKGIVFSCTNSKPSGSTSHNDVGGIGLKNIRRRLNLLFPGKHELTINDGEGRYCVTLKLEL